jgi:hypothetical protein
MRSQQVPTAASVCSCSTLVVPATAGAMHQGHRRRTECCLTSYRLRPGNVGPGRHRRPYSQPALHRGIDAGDALRRMGTGVRGTQMRTANAAVSVTALMPLCPCGLADRLSRQSAMQRHSGGTPSSRHFAPSMARFMPVAQACSRRSLQIKAQGAGASVSRGVATSAAHRR